MNTAKSLNSSRTRNSRPGLKMAARQLGIDPAELGKEAQGLWAMLDDMSENDPEGYQKFLKEQREQYEEDKKKRVNRGRFYPNCGFVTKTFSFGPIKKSNLDISLSNSTNSVKLFVNCCSFERIEPPIDAAGKAVKGDVKVNTSGMQIPMALGEPRIIQDSSGNSAVAIDVVFNDWVMQQCKKYQSFKFQVVELALVQVENDLDVKISRKYKIIQSLYKGGKLIDGKIQTHPFIVDPNIANLENDDIDGLPESSKTESPNNILNNPTDLLAQIRRTDAEDTSSLIETKSEYPVNEILCKKNVMSTEPDTRDKKGKSLIEEIGPESDRTTPVSGFVKKEIIPANKSMNTAKATKTNAVKKGFLNNKETNLYPNGSNEGAPTGKSIFQKAKIVDLNNMSEEEARKAMEKHAVGSNRVKTKANDTSRMKEAKTNRYGDKLQEMLTESFSEFSSNEKDMFAKLAEAADPELMSSSINNNKDASSLETNDLFLKMAQTMAGMRDMDIKSESQHTFSSHSSTSESDAQKNDKNYDSNVRSNFHNMFNEKEPMYSIKVSKEKRECAIRFELPGIESLGNANVEIAKDQVKLHIQGKYKSKVALQELITHEDAIAKFNKKKSQLVIKVKLL